LHFFTPNVQGVERKDTIMNMIKTTAIAAAMIAAMASPTLASWNGAAPAAATPGAASAQELALTLEEMNCASSDTSNQIPCPAKGRT
jgi:hypothetical protein